MEVDRVVFGGRTQDAGGQALEALRLDWDEAYDIEYDGEWRARRLDGLGGWIPAGTPGSLRQMIRADYDVKPVPRGLRPAGG